MKLCWIGHFRPATFARPLSPLRPLLQPLTVPFPRVQTVVNVRRSMLSLADGLPHLHTDTIGPRNVSRAPAHFDPAHHAEHFARGSQRVSNYADGSKTCSFFYDLPTQPDLSRVAHPDHGQAAVVSPKTHRWLPPDRRAGPSRFPPDPQDRPLDASGRIWPVPPPTAVGHWRFGYNPGFPEASSTRRIFPGQQHFR